GHRARRAPLPRRPPQGFLFPRRRRLGPRPERRTHRSRLQKGNRPDHFPTPQTAAHRTSRPPARPAPIENPRDRRRDRLQLARALLARIQKNGRHLPRPLSRPTPRIHFARRLLTPPTAPSAPT